MTTEPIFTLAVFLLFACLVHLVRWVAVQHVAAHEAMDQIHSNIVSDTQAMEADFQKQLVRMLAASGDGTSAGHECAYCKTSHSSHHCPSCGAPRTRS